MLRVVIWVLCAALSLKVISSRREGTDPGETFIQTLVQCKYSSDEIRCIQEGVTPSNLSSLKGLHPFIHSQKSVRRMSSRQNSDLLYEQNYPVIPVYQKAFPVEITSEVSSPFVPNYIIWLDHALSSMDMQRFKFRLCGYTFEINMFPLQQRSSKGCCS